MTYTLPYELTNAAILIAACLHSGLDLRSELKRRADLLTRHTTTATRQPAEESPAVLTALGLPATPAPEPEPESVEDYLAGIRLH